MESIKLLLDLGSTETGTNGDGDLLKQRSHTMGEGAIETGSIERIPKA